jgi:hypothetical protein
MAASKIYLVPLDFSRGSLRAFDYALMLSRENKGQLVALNVVPAELIYPPTAGSHTAALAASDVAVDASS